MFGNLTYEYVKMPQVIPAPLERKLKKNKRFGRWNDVGCFFLGGVWVSDATRVPTPKVIFPSPDLMSFC